TYTLPLAIAGVENFAKLPMLSAGESVVFQSSFVTSLALMARTMPGQVLWFASHPTACATQSIAVLSTLPLLLVAMQAPLFPTGPCNPLVISPDRSKFPAAWFTGHCLRAVFSDH